MFEGYCPETVDFLWGIRLNNNREWFMAHKPDYVKYLYEPTKELGKALLDIVKPGTLVKVSRIYRDSRMHHPLPYKESLWICIRQDVEWWAENPCLYFEINPDRIHYGFFFYHIKPQIMERIRQDMQIDPDNFRKLMRAAQKITGVPVSADVLYKRPKPTENPKLAPYFAWKEQIGCVVEEEFSPATFGPELGERVKNTLRGLMPLYEYFCRFTSAE